jgi:N-terminal acetyltransferase B complex catalytic subunit
MISTSTSPTWPAGRTSSTSPRAKTAPSMLTVLSTTCETNAKLTCSLVMGKLESSPSYVQYSEHYLPFHAHITALTVAPHARRQGLARTLSESLERSGDEYDAWFVDLFVRKSNKIAQALYRGMGYSVYRRVLDYYSDDPTGASNDGEDAYDMRKPLKRDKDLKHIRENGEDFAVDPNDVW